MKCSENGKEQRRGRVYVYVCCPALMRRGNGWKGQEEREEGGVEGLSEGATGVCACSVGCWWWWKGGGGDEGEVGGRDGEC